MYSANVRVSVDEWSKGMIWAGHGASVLVSEQERSHSIRDWREGSLNKGLERRLTQDWRGLTQQGIGEKAHTLGCTRELVSAVMSALTCSLVIIRLVLTGHDHHALGHVSALTPKLTSALPPALLPTRSVSQGKGGGKEGGARGGARRGGAPPRAPVQHQQPEVSAPPPRRPPSKLSQPNLSHEHPNAFLFLTSRNPHQAIMAAPASPAAASAFDYAELLWSLPASIDGKLSLT
eukprot:352615-Chlamydomonas_euryale.AAC.2